MVTGRGKSSNPYYRGPPSDHFDGTRFFNPDGHKPRNLGDLLKWQLGGRRARWPRALASPFPKALPETTVAKGTLRTTMVGHASLLIQVPGLNILTDPVWSQRVSPLSFIGPQRINKPGIAFADLPKIDVVLVSHNHYDHLDLATLRRLAARDRPRFFVGLGNRALLEKAGLERVAELDWWQTVPLGEGVELTGVPAQHFSNRGLFDRDGTLWLGYLLRGPAGTTFFAGDTGAGPHFAEIRRRYGAPRLALLPIGAFRPEWFMGGVHVSPEEAIAAHEALGAATSVGIHFGTFPLADDGEEEAPVALRAALARRPEASRPRFLVLAPGEGHDVQ
jgi:L-ascorbate metabolism protein UlaG (beta-lactamase superfamily)